MFLCHQNLMCPMDVLAITSKMFKRQFQNYRVASGLNKEPNEFQSAVFLATVGEHAMDISDGFKFEQEADMQDLGKIMEKFEDFCVGETHEAYESYKFYLRCQEPSETIESYISSLLNRQRTVTLEFSRTE